MDFKTQLATKIDNRTAQIGVVGIGYVGLPLAVAFAEAGFTVVGVDVDQHKVDQLNRGESYIGDVDETVLQALVESGRLSATADYAALEQVDAVSICVPTPLRKTRDPDISFIVNATENIVAHGSAGKLIVLESTTYPGTTDEVILPRLSANEQLVGDDFFLAFSPERIDPGRTDYTVATTPKVMGGVTADCLDIATLLYNSIVDQVVPVSSTASAEMVKLLENTFRAVNIGLVNEIALICDKLGLDVWEVVEAAATKPYGFMPFYPGPGLGGHCIPVDPHYLSWKMRTLDYKARFIELADEVNRAMPDYVVRKIGDSLNEAKKAVNGSRILILGVAYKPNVSDVRESPALDIIQLLQAKGADVFYNDPHVPILADELFDLSSTALTESLLQDADCVVIVTDHEVYDWHMIEKSADLIIDTRNALPKTEFSTVVKL